MVGIGHVLFDAQLVHYLLEQTRHNVRPLVRLNREGDADKTKKKHSKSLNDALCFDIPEGNSLRVLRGSTHNREQILIPRFPSWEGDPHNLPKP